MTPRAFYALVERHRQSRRHGLYCAAVTASAIYNVNRKEGSPAIGPEDMLVKSGAKASTGRQSADDMLMIVRGVLNPMFNGIEISKEPK